MANELRINGYAADRTMTARISNAAGRFYNVDSEAFETYGAGGHDASSYAIAMTDVGAGAYRGDFPTAITTRGTYIVDFWDSTVSTQAVLQQVIAWTGTGVEPDTDLGDPVTIVNDALLQLSGAVEVQRILSLDGTDPTSVLCAEQYPKSRREVLVAVQPHYAMKFGNCGAALSGVDLPEASDWTYAFDLPDDCLARLVGYQTDAANRLARYEHKVMGDYLLTDTLSDLTGVSAYIYYLANLTDVALMSQELQWAISCKLAYRLSASIDPKQTELRHAAAEAAINDAILKDSWLCRQEEGDYSWLSARR